MLAALTLGAAGASAANRAPTAVAAASFDPSGHPVATAERFVGPSPGETIAITLTGAASTDPDGDALAYRWACHDSAGNKCPLIAQVASGADLRVTLPAGTWLFTLTVEDSHGASASDLATVMVRVDNAVPVVTPPEDVVLPATEPGGTRPRDSSKLAQWLAGALAMDNSTASPQRLTPMVGDDLVGDDTLFPLNQPTEVTFRFADRFGNLGTAASTVRVRDLEENDIYVGTARPVAALGHEVGAITRIRGGSVETFCESSITAFDPYLFGAPSDAVVDSSGRVVFLADMASANVNLPHHGLFHCDFPGDTPKLLAVYTGAGTRPPGDPVPFPGEIFERVNGLHLERSTAIVIDDDENGGQPQLVKSDAYVFAAKRLNPNDGTVASLESVRFRAADGTSEDGPEPVQEGAGANWTAIPDMTRYGPATYSAAGGKIRRTSAGLTLEARGRAFGVDFEARLTLLGGVREIGGGSGTGRFEDIAASTFLLDNLDAPDYPSQCPPPPAGVDPNMPSPPGGPHVGLASLGEVAVSEDFGLTVTSSSIFLAPYVTDIDQSFLDDDPGNDNCCRFQRLELACNIRRKIGVRYPLPFWDPATGVPNGAERVVSAPDGGLVGTQRFGDRVVRVVRGTKAEEIAAGLGAPSGIAVYPAQLGSWQGLTVIMRIDSPVDVLVTDPAGRGLGVDAAGQAVNGFGSEFALDSGPATHPRFYMIRNAMPGPYAVRSTGTGTGPFAIHVYGIEMSGVDGAHAVATGLAEPGRTQRHDFVLEAGGKVTFLNSPPAAQAGADRSLAADATGLARVTLDGRGSDPDGDPLSFVWSGPFGVALGAAPAVTLPVGTHALKLSVADGRGGVGTDTVTVSVASGSPRLSGAVSGKGSHPSGAYFVDVRLTNTGTGLARDVVVAQVPLRTLSGTGQVTYNATLSPTLPLAVGDIAPGASATLRLYLNRPSTVTRFSIGENGTLKNAAGVASSFALGQAVIP